MSDEHHHHQTHHHHHHHHGDGDQYHQEFFNMEDILRTDFELKKDRLIDFLRRVGPKEGQRVLELGCGFAPLFDFYCEAVGPTGGITLMDPEARLGDSLAAKLATHPNARFVAGRAENLLQALGSEGAVSFDVAIMVNVYHHLSDPESVLAALRKVTVRLLVVDFVHDTFRVFASAGAPPEAKAVQARLAELVRPEASAVTALCPTRLEANGFAMCASESYVLQDRLNGTKLGDFYAGLFFRSSLERLSRRWKITQEERDQLIKEGLTALKLDPDAVLFSEVQVMLAADAV